MRGLKHSIGLSLKDSHFNFAMVDFLHSMAVSVKSCLSTQLRILRDPSLWMRALTCKAIYVLALLLVRALSTLTYIKIFIYKTYMYMYISIKLLANMGLSGLSPSHRQLNLFRWRLI